MDASARRFEESWPNFVELLQDRAARQPMQRALGFLTDGELGEVWSTFRDLDDEARAIAARLQTLGWQGRTALLLYWPGMEFVTALLGCFYAGVIAVPVHPPRPRRSLARLEAITADSGATLALTSGALLPELGQQFYGHPLLGSLCWLATDSVERAQASRWQPPHVTAASLACLQYTSGSTADPKGVMLSHGNLLCNSRLIYDAFGHGPDSVGVIWLPPYHDMGLIGGILQPLFGGFPTLLMSPVHVVQQPLRWLRAIGRFRATTSGGPNFIYDACVERIRADECDGLDLASWQTAFNGAEPIRAETLDRFREKFAPFGFRPEMFFPCYGLAEATLFVSGGPRAAAPVTRIVSKDSLENHAVAAAADAGDEVRVVACGRPAAGQEVAIVDPETLTRCPETRVGEIWVAGPSIAQGYWGRGEQTEAAFHAQIAGGDGRPFLRTGDLGFIGDGQLYITGRLKDLLIIDGRNHYPQDIELTVEKCHSCLRTHSGAAFTLDQYSQKLVVVHEVARNGRRADPDEVVAAIRAAISEQHELAVHAIVLVKVGGVPKTPSGKIQRRQCRELYMHGDLPLVAQWCAADAPVEDRCASAAPPAEPAASVAPPESTAPPPAVSEGAHESAEAIRDWLVARVAARLKCDPREIDVRHELACFGLKSRDALELTGELERWLNRRLSPTLIYQHPSIESLSQHLNGKSAPASKRAAASHAPRPAPEPIAIVGIGCRFPGAAGPDAFWRKLVEGYDAITEVPPDRWNADAVDQMVGGVGASDVQGTVRWGGWLPEIDQFDPGFFGIARREAACIDPQQRLLMEIAWETLEDAGQPADRIRGSNTGVFVGVSTNDYRRNFLLQTSQLDPYWTTGNASSIAANRLSYFFDFHGPSLAVDTACSSALVAVHWACNSLRSGECELALAGGVNLILSPDISFSFVKGGGLAPDGRCKAFDARANGIVRSEGVGLIALKRLAQAQADGDRIYAVIRGGAVNQDGRTNGITAPNQTAQEAVLREAWRHAGVAPSEAQYVETHGAGTLLGDVIEANALKTVLSEDRPADRRCAIGSVKTNIGHCESAAGIAGLIKVALAMHHGQLPANLHFSQPNPLIRFEETPLAVQTALGAWPAVGGRRLAGVSSFGFGGTNAHLVVESVPSSPPSAAVEPMAEPAVQLLPLSAATRPALAAVAARWEDLAARADLAAPTALADVCYAAAMHRSHLDHRAALRFRTQTELCEQLAAVRKGKGHPAVTVGRVAAGRRPRVVFVFSGHGGQWRGMHRPLMDAFPAFRVKMEQCDLLLREHAGWSLLAELNTDPARSLLEDGSVEVAQTCLLAFQVGLAEAWKLWGIEPDAVVGHSMGEVAAAHVAGAISLRDAVRIIVERSRLLQQALEELSDVGAMAALRVSGPEAEELLRGYENRVWIAVQNSPSYTVVSGDLPALEQLIAQLRTRKIGARLMNVPGAAHTPRLEPTRLRLQAALDGLQPETARVPFYSTVSGVRRDGRELDAAYWGHNVRQGVRFAPAIDCLLDEGYRAFIEMGPHPLLTAAVLQCAEHRGKDAVMLPSLRRDDRDLETMLGAFGGLFAHGADVDWRRVLVERRSRVALPTYPWQHERCWIEAVAPAAAVAATALAGGVEPPVEAPQPGEPGAPPPADAAVEAPSGAAFLQVLRAAPLGEKSQLLSDYFRGHFARALGAEPARIDIEQPLMNLGVDSLMATEIKNRVESELGLQLHVAQLLASPTIAGLADMLLPQIDAAQAAPAQTAQQGAATPPDKEGAAGEEANRLLAQIDGLSDEQVDALVHRILAQ